MGQGLQDIGYCEVASPDGEFSVSSEGDGVKLVRTIQLDDPAALFQALRCAPGFPLGGGGLSRWLPDAYPAPPNSSGQEWLYCTKVLRTIAAGPVGGGAGGVPTAYTVVRLVLLYESLTYDVLPDGGPEYARFLTALPRSSVEFDTGLRGTYCWQQGPNSTDTFTNGNPVPPNTQPVELFSGLAVAVGVGDIVWVWHDVPDGAFSPAALDAATGKLNADSFNIGGNTYGIETLLLNSWTMVPKKSAAGDRTWTITFNVKRLNQSHNHFRDADGNFWLVGVRDNPTKTPYATTEFDQLFTPTGPP